MTKTLGPLAIAAIVLVCAAIGRADAQTPGRFYVGGSAGTFSVDADDVDGGSFSAGVLGGVSLNHWLDIEAEIAFPTRRFTRTYGGDAVSISFGRPGTPDFERLGVWIEYYNERDVSMSISSVAIFHGPIHPRVEAGFVAGITTQQVTERTDYTPVRIGAGLNPTVPWAQPRSEVYSRNPVFPTFAANVAVALTRHLRIVPDIRFDYGSLGDEINNALRSSVRVHWRF